MYIREVIRDVRIQVETQGQTGNVELTNGTISDYLTIQHHFVYLVIKPFDVIKKQGKVDPKEKLDQKVAEQDKN